MSLLWPRWASTDALFTCKPLNTVHGKHIQHLWGVCGFAVTVRFNFAYTCAQSQSYPERADVEEEALTVFMGELGQYSGFHQCDIFTLPLETPEILHCAKPPNSGKWVSVSTPCVISVTLSVLAPVTKLPPSGRKSVISFPELWTLPSCCQPGCTPQAGLQMPAFPWITGK